jgi:secreted PhoX family phosphatase
MEPAGFSRRILFKGGAATLFAAGPLLDHAVAAATRRNPPQAMGYGSMKRDPRGILDLPPSFDYRIISRTGDLMDDGLRVPRLPEGMHAFPGKAGRVWLLRSHLVRQPAVFRPYVRNHRTLGCREPA